MLKSENFLDFFGRKKRKKRERKKNINPLISARTPSICTTKLFYVRNLFRIVIS